MTIKNRIKKLEGQNAEFTVGYPDRLDKEGELLSRENINTRELVGGIRFTVYEMCEVRSRTTGMREPNEGFEDFEERAYKIANDAMKPTVWLHHMAKYL